MTRKSKTDFDGSYRIERSPRSLKPHNAASWEILVALAREAVDGTMDFNRMIIAVKNHESGAESAPHDYQFVTYCINSGWLKRV